MSESLFSQSWYRVASLKPRLRSHVQIDRHCYRGQDWYVIQDKFTGRHHRFSPEAYQLIGLMDGHRSLGRIWETACANLDAHMPTQDEVIGLLSMLSRSDLLQTSALPNFTELQQRQDKGRRQRFLSSIRSPVFLRIPILDPDRFLSATISWVNPFLGWTTMVVWFLVVGLAGFLVTVHWTDLTNNFTDQMLGLENLLLVSLLYPVLKALHEFAHAYMVKKWGGEVHEMGILLLVFMPIPYIDASSSLAFREKHKRMLVAAAGILVEVFVAATALLVWLLIEPGAVRAAAYNIMLIAGISTVLFNGNPLLRFDAYYVLADWLEIPNLGQRSNRYLGYLVQRYLIGVEQLDSQVSSMKEAGWLALYGVTSFCYRIFISLRIVLFVAGKFFVIGMILAIWVATAILITPVSRVTRFLLRDAQMRQKRGRVFLVIVLPILLLTAALFFVPVPSYTICQGVIREPEEARVHAAVDGFIAEIVTASGSRVEPGAVLLRTEDPQLDTRVQLLEARREEFIARYNLSKIKNMIDASILKEAIDQIDAEISRARERQQALTVRSSEEGVFVLPQEEDLAGRFFHRGETVGYVLKPEKMRIRVVVSQAQVDQVRGDTRRVDVRLAEDVDRVIPAAMVREIPAASRELPSLALSLGGGGRFALDPREHERLQVLEGLFQFEIKTQNPVPYRIEERVFVRFEHQPEPLPSRWYRSMRRLLLSRFAV